MRELKNFLLSKVLFDVGRFKGAFFTRNRVFSFKSIILFIINLAKKSLHLELRDFTKMCGVKSVTKQAFSKARLKLNPIVFKLLNEKFVSEFYTDNDFKTFEGFRVLAIDGSTIQLPSSNEIVSFYGCCSGSAGLALPMAQSSTLFDVFNKITVDSVISPYKASEKNQALELLKSLVSINKKIDFDQGNIKDLLIFDRGYPSMQLIIELIRNKKDFLMRCPSNFINPIREARKKGKVDQIIEIEFAKLSEPTLRSLKKTISNFDENKKIKLRVLCLGLSSGEKELLLTTVLEKNHTPIKLFKLYQKRWDIEENYKFIKSIAAVENFSGKSKITVEQDFYATVLTCNIASMLMQEAEDEINEIMKEKKLKYRYKVNKNIALGLLKNELIEVLIFDKDLNQFCEQIKLQMQKALVPVRPNRSFQRSKSIKRNHAPNRRSCL